MSTQTEKETKEPLKMKKKVGRPRKYTNTKEEVTKLDLTKKEEDAIPEQSAGNVDAVEQTKDVEKVEERAPEPRLEEVTEEKVETKNEDANEEVTVINEVKEEAQELTKQAEQAIVKEETTGVQLPENIKKLVDFMQDTGGTVEDYVTLNKDYTKFDDNLLVREYYKKTKPHLDDSEISFLMEDKFNYDEEVDEERFVRKQKLAYKEEVAKARTFLDKMKSKYYDEIKLRPSTTNEQQKAMDFFNRYNKEQSVMAETRNRFIKNTKDLFNNEFKGFDFNVGEKKFRYKVSNPFQVADNQDDVGKFVKPFTNDKGEISDLSGYHKALYVARNADRIAEHFYEQGKADATRDIVSKSKNIDNTPRSGEQGETMPNGWKVRAISGPDATKLRIKKRT
jgi:hypothetical protein